MRSMVEGKMALGRFPSVWPLASHLPMVHGEDQV